MQFLKLAAQREALSGLGVVAVFDALLKGLNFFLEGIEQPRKGNRIALLETLAFVVKNLVS